MIWVTSQWDAVEQSISEELIDTIGNGVYNIQTRFSQQNEEREKKSRNKGALVSARSFGESDFG